jgi:hypothetical protein
MTYGVPATVPVGQVEDWSDEVDMLVLGFGMAPS